MSLREQGFSLLEIITAVSIIAIVASLSVPSYFNTAEERRRDAAISRLQELRNDQEVFYMRNRRFADSLDELQFAAPTDGEFAYSITSATADDYVIQAQRSGDRYRLEINRAGTLTGTATPVPSGGTGGGPNR